jgi:hypothetical protein
MKPGPSIGHANHDESLVVRLYGNDVSPDERALALDLVAGCEECAALFADMGEIASATAALPTPVRPRDFMLTPADAVRLRPAQPARGRSAWRGLTRQLGGAFATLGLVGIIVAGASTAIAPAATSENFALSSSTGNQDALQGVGAGAPGLVSTAQPIAAATSASSDVTKAAVGSPAPAVSPGASAATSRAASPAASHNESASLAIGQALSPSAGPAQIAGGQPQLPAQPASGGSVDTRLAVLIASATLLLVGLALLIGPRLRARRIRG